MRKDSLKTNESMVKKIRSFCRPIHMGVVGTLSLEFHSKLLMGTETNERNASIN